MKRFMLFALLLLALWPVSVQAVELEIEAPSVLLRRWSLPVSPK